MERLQALAEALQVTIQDLIREEALRGIEQRVGMR